MVEEDLETEMDPDANAGIRRFSGEILGDFILMLDSLLDQDHEVIQWLNTQVDNDTNKENLPSKSKP